MTTGRKVDATPLFRRELDLFASLHEARKHLVRHVLDACESRNWALLIPALQAHLDAGRRAALHDRARGSEPSRVPELAEVWRAFLDAVTEAVEQGVGQGWYWEEDRRDAEGPYRTFACSGILAYLDDDVVRTGFLPWCDGPPAGATPQDQLYQLFFKCWQKVRDKYQNAVQEGRVVQAPATLQALMSKVPDRATWAKLRGAARCSRTERDRS